MQMVTAITDYIKPYQRTNDAEKKLRKAKLEYANDMLDKADILQERVDQERAKALRMKRECSLVGRITKKVSEFFNRGNA